MSTPDRQMKTARADDGRICDMRRAASRPTADTNSWIAIRGGECSSAEGEGEGEDIVISGLQLQVVVVAIMSVQHHVMIITEGAMAKQPSVAMQAKSVTGPRLMQRGRSGVRIPKRTQTVSMTYSRLYSCRIIFDLIQLDPFNG